MSGHIVQEKSDTAVFVVEHDPATRREISRALSGLPWPVYGYETPRALLADLDDLRHGCVVATVQQFDMSITELLEALRRDRQRMALIVLSRDMEIPEAVAAMRAGVHDVLPLPVVERTLRRQVRAAIETPRVSPNCSCP